MTHLNERIAFLRRQRDAATNPVDRQQFDDMIAQLSVQDARRHISTISGGGQGGAHIVGDNHAPISIEVVVQV